MDQFLSYKEAKTTVDRCTQVLAAKTVPLSEASGHVLGFDVQSNENVPSFDNSAMDGFAVRATDTESATKEFPVELRVIGKLHAGDWPPQKIGAGESIQIMTGAPMPEGSDAVVMVEKSELANGTVRIFEKVSPGEHRRPAGDDIQKGECVFSAGRVLDPYDIGVLASMGHATVPVIPLPSVALVATGDELVELDQPLSPGKIRASSRYALAAHLRQLGCPVLDLGLVRDDPRAVEAALRKAFTCDAVLTTGGVSMGEHDFVRTSLEEIGVDLKFWKVKQKPGKPLVFGTSGHRLFFGLPGNPVSTLLCYKLYAEPALRKMAGHTLLDLPQLRAVLKDSLRKKTSLTQFFRGRVYVEDNRIAVTVSPNQSSGVLSSLAFSNALIVAEEGISELSAGTEVTVLLIRPMDTIDYSKP
ncbi:MAG: molybdopterin molybdotransferase MoeA [Bacteroidetes bacterium]|nr:molybdopterin molybdotransferase MoeA [Bacteroidota bacterium]